MFQCVRHTLLRALILSTPVFALLLPVQDAYFFLMYGPNKKIKIYVVSQSRALMGEVLRLNLSCNFAAYATAPEPIVQLCCVRHRIVCLVV